MSEHSTTHTAILREVARTIGDQSPATHPAVAELNTINQAIATTIRQIVWARDYKPTPLELELFEAAVGTRFTSSPDGVHGGACMLCLARNSKCECEVEDEGSVPWSAKMLISAVDRLVTNFLAEPDVEFPVGSRVHVLGEAWNDAWVGTVTVVSDDLRTISWDDDPNCSVSSCLTQCLEPAGDQDFRP
jgi:hypothetical protein